MKKILAKHKIIQAVVVATLLTGVLLARMVSPASADTGTIDLTTSSSSVTVGDNFVVTVTAHTDAAVTIAQARITYNASAVSIQGAVDYSGSPFDSNTPESTSSSGSYTISRFKLGSPYPSGDIHIAKITFKALKDSGSAGISGVKADSVLYSATAGGPTTDILSAINGVGVNLKTVPAGAPSANPSAPTSGGSTSGSGSSSSGATSGGTTSTPSGTSDAPSLGDVSVGTQPPSGSIGDPAPAAEAGSPDSGVEGLAISKYTKAITIGVTAAIAIGAAGYLFWFLHRRNGFSIAGFHKSTPGTINGPKPVVFDATKPANPGTPPTPSGIITPDHKDIK